MVAAASGDPRKALENHTRSSQAGLEVLAEVALAGSKVRADHVVGSLLLEMWPCGSWSLGPPSYNDERRGFTILEPNQRKVVFSNPKKTRMK